MRIVWLLRYRSHGKYSNSVRRKQSHSGIISIKFECCFWEILHWEGTLEDGKGNLHNVVGLGPASFDELSCCEFWPPSKGSRKRRKEILREREKVSVLMQRLSYPTKIVLSYKIARNRKVLSFKDSPRKPLGRRPCNYSLRKTGWPTGNGKTLSCSQTQLGQATWLAVA